LLCGGATSMTGVWWVQAATTRPRTKAGAGADTQLRAALTLDGDSADGWSPGAAMRLRSCCSKAARRARSQVDTSFLTAVLAISWLLFRRRPVDGSVSRPRANLRGQAGLLSVARKAANLASHD